MIQSAELCVDHYIHTQHSSQVKTFPVGFCLFGATCRVRCISYFAHLLPQVKNLDNLHRRGHKFMFPDGYNSL
jgi:hypothetical protein